MNAPASLPPPTHSWKDIRQGVRPRAMSHEGHRRRLRAGLKVAGLGVLVAVCAWAVFEVYDTWQGNPAWLKDAGQTVPLRQVVFATDGVLDRAWLDRTLMLPPKASLMALDLRVLERRLLASGQVRSAVLRRRFGDNALVVTVQERTPVARLSVEIGAAVPTTLLVARDGVAYAGAGYGEPAVARLPWLDGVQLRRAEKNGFEPIAGLEQVAALLAAAREVVPESVEGWQIISLARLASDDELMVQSQEIPKIVLNAREDYSRQLAKLHVIVENLRVNGAPALEQVNLALGSQVPVRLRDAPPLQPEKPSPPTTPFQPKPKRDF